ncbi:hypothetical protein [Microvirga antarctica]|uniref:hypothetical protein n=1 Tax=Microvirga antarctica TaxID=2819233 RepID=UPI001B30D7E3|nr:hypothetical protein [Microvirga antarctica]
MTRAAALLSTIAVCLAIATPARALEALPAPAGPVILTVVGKIGVTNAPGEARFDRAMLDAIGHRSLTTMTPATGRRHRFEGVSLKAVLDRVGANGQEIRAVALNDFEAVIPVSDLRFDPLVASTSDGEPLKMRDKGPLWIVYPRDDFKDLDDLRYDSRWVWQLYRLDVE